METFTLLLEVVVILAASTLVSALLRRSGQPRVIGQMVAGILIGPSFLGAIAPVMSAQLFPPAALGHLSAMSQFGLVIYMLLVGVSLDHKEVRTQGHAAVVISHVSIVVPFFLGGLLSLYLYPRLGEDSVSFTGFTLFLGAAMSITAFPVLARILSEENLMGTRLGSLTIACAAVDDVTGWCILASILAIVNGAQSAYAQYVTVLSAAVYIAVMLLVMKPLLARAEPAVSRLRLSEHSLLTLVVCLGLTSALITDWLGIHALFGAFLFGAILPRSGFLRVVPEKLQSFVEALLLPLFFAFTGLRTSIGLLNGADMWFYWALAMGVAVLAKLGGCLLAARASGIPWTESLSIGLLMNTRGLMELVILNIGLDAGIISPSLFAIMVLMALSTTFMTTPLLRLCCGSRLRQLDSAAAAARSLPTAG
jgi:Kef-type K+ transport system membrane component KefB